MFHSLKRFIQIEKNEHRASGWLVAGLRALGASAMLPAIGLGTWQTFDVGNDPEGRIRYFGFTHYTVGAHRELADLIKKESPDFVQFNYSIATRDAERELLPVAAANKTAVLINRPFEGASLFQAVQGKPLPPWAAEIDCESWAQFFLKYIVAHPAVTCAIPATRNPKHLTDNIKAGVGRLPDEKMRQKMVEYFGSL